MSQQSLQVTAGLLQSDQAHLRGSAKAMFWPGYTEPCIVILTGSGYSTSKYHPTGEKSSSLSKA